MIREALLIDLWTRQNWMQVISFQRLATCLIRSLVSFYYSPNRNGMSQRCYLCEPRNVHQRILTKYIGH